MKTPRSARDTSRASQLAAGVLVDAAWLDAHLHDPAVRVVEVDVSRRAHDEWHIEGAVLWDVYRDLKDADYRLIGTEATMSAAGQVRHRTRAPSWCSTATRPPSASGS